MGSCYIAQGAQLDLCDDLEGWLWGVGGRLKKGKELAAPE